MASAQNQQYPTQPQQSTTPDYDKHNPNTGNQNPSVPPQYQGGSQYPQYCNVPPPLPPGAYLGTTIHTPQQASWVSSGANVAGVVIAGRCLIGFVTSGIFLIISALIMFVQANNIDYFNRSNYTFTNPLRIMAPIFLTLGIAFLVGGILGIIFAIRAVNKQRAEAITTTTTVAVGAAPIISGRPVNPNLYGQQNQGYYGTAYPQGVQSSSSNQGQGAYPQQSYGQASSGYNDTFQNQNEMPPPYQPTAGSNVPLQKY